MVKIGIIVEGDSEKIILDSPTFQSFLHENDLELVDEIVSIEGKSNLKPDAQKVNSKAQILFDEGAEWLVILRDMDAALSFEEVAKEVFQTPVTKLCLTVKQSEAWYLADSIAMQKLLRLDDDFLCDYPEEAPVPGQIINELSLQHTGRGLGWNTKSAKVKLAKRILVNGFSIEKAAEHPNCPSARYFLTTLQTLASAK